MPRLTRRARLGDPLGRGGLTVDGGTPGVAELGQLADRRGHLAAVEREQAAVGPERDGVIGRCAGVPLG